MIIIDCSGSMGAPRTKIEHATRHDRSPSAEACREIADRRVRVGVHEDVS